MNHMLDHNGGVNHIILGLNFTPASKWGFVFNIIIVFTNILCTVGSSKG